MTTFIKSSVITFIIVFGLGYWLFVPSSTDIAQKQFQKECTAPYKNLKNVSDKNNIINGCYLLAKEKFK